MICIIMLGLYQKIYKLPSAVSVVTTFLWDVSNFHERFEGDVGFVLLSVFFHSTVGCAFWGNSPEFDIATGSDFIRKSKIFLSNKKEQLHGI